MKSFAERADNNNTKMVNSRPVAFQVGVFFLVSPTISISVFKQPRFSVLVGPLRFMVVLLAAWRHKIFSQSLFNKWMSWSYGIEPNPPITILYNANRSCNRVHIYKDFLAIWDDGLLGFVMFLQVYNEDQRKAQTVAVKMCFSAILS